MRRAVGRFAQARKRSFSVASRLENNVALEPFRGSFMPALAGVGPAARAVFAVREDLVDCSSFGDCSFFVAFVGLAAFVVCVAFATRRTRAPRATRRLDPRALTL